MPMRQLVRGDKNESPVTDDAPVAVADGETAMERRLIVGRGPVGDIAAGRAAVVVANPLDDSVSILASETLALIDTIALGGEPVAVAVTDDRAYVATASVGCDAVSAIDLESRRIVATYTLSSGVTALAVSPDGKRVYAGRSDGDRVDLTVIDTTAERVGTIAVGSAPAANIDAVRVDPSGKRLHVAVTDDIGSQLVVVDAETTRVKRVIPVGSPIRDIAYAGDAVYALTSDRAVGGAVVAIDLATGAVTDTLTLGGAPTQLAVSPDEAHAYVVDYDRVAVVCTSSLEVIESLPVDARPSCVASAADGSRLFVADYSGAVDVYSVESTIEMVYSQFLATDPIALSVPRARQPVAV